MASKPSNRGAAFIAHLVEDVEVSLAQLLRVQAIGLQHVRIHLGREERRERVKKGENRQKFETWDEETDRSQNMIGPRETQRKGMETCQNRPGNPNTK